MEYSSNGKGNLGVTLGAIGTGLGVLQNGMGLLSGLTGNKNGTSEYITREEADMMQTLANKDSEIALLRADKAIEGKMTEIYKNVYSDISALRNDTNASIKEVQGEINANRRYQDEWNSSQAVNNAQISAAIATNTNSIMALQSTIGQFTQTKIPNTAVCPGWGTVNITPTTTTTTGTTIA